MKIKNKNKFPINIIINPSLKYILLNNWMFLHSYLLKVNKRKQTNKKTGKNNKIQRKISILWFFSNSNVIQYVNIPIFLI